MEPAAHLGMAIGKNLGRVLNRPLNKETAAAILALLFIIMAGLRIAIAFSEPTLTFDGYKQLRLTEYITDHGTPLRDDPLSYGGRNRLYSPVFNYLMAPFALFLPSVIVLKFLSNLLFASVILLVYYISQDITKRRGASLVAATLAAFTPVIFSHAVNDASPTALSVPLLLLAVYAALDIGKRLPLLLISGVLLALASPLIFVFLLGLAFFLIILAAERLPPDGAYGETLLFLLFFGIWTMLLYYRDAFLQKGFAAIWGYLPTTLRSTYFAEFTLVSAVTIVGILPLLFGGYAAYRALFTERIRKVLLLSSMVGAVALPLLLKLIPIRLGMVLLALVLCALSGEGLRHFFGYFQRMRMPSLRYVAGTLLLLFFVFASAIPALSVAAELAGDAPSADELAAYRSLADQDVFVLAAPKEGFAIEQVAGVPVFADRDFVLISNVDTLYDEAEAIYRSRFALPALERLNKRGITHLVVGPESQALFARSSLLYADSQCLDPVYVSGPVTIYKVICDVKTQ